jgi:indole-3-glycerol phosphate synthase
VPKREVEIRAAQMPSSCDFQSALQRTGVGLIAEVKRASPSKGILRDDLDPVHCAQIYQHNGAVAVSVLTEENFFKGSLKDLQTVCEAVSLPVLRKDFIFDPYQVYESRAAGADAVLLIIAILSDALLANLYRLINQLGMAALVEVHDAGELRRALSLSPGVVGINNRDLMTFKVNLDTTALLIPQCPRNLITVAESGIHSRPDVQRLHELGVNAMLVGESIVTADDIGARVRALCTAGR